uniref:Uncharacterized protein n=1 Tax=Arundo donax TaxID=35708 RepID=A0A0A9GPV9_ARUDO
MIPWVTWVSFRQQLQAELICGGVSWLLEMLVAGRCFPLDLGSSRHFSDFVLSDVSGVIGFGVSES